jgi:hypothetical protein
MKLCVLICLLIALFLIPVTAFAGSLVFDPFDPFNDCTGINCASTIINGTYHADAAGDADPFILQVYSGGNECVRLDVIAATRDLEMVLISPTGTIWRNNDRNASNPRPLIKAITDVNGWYTLQVSQFNGANVTADFTLKYGRHNPGNPNCSPETPSL